MENRYCECGEPLDHTARFFCPGCGQSLVDPSPTSSPSSLQRLMRKRVLGTSALIVVAAVIACVVLLASIGVKWEGITDDYGVIHWPISFGKESTQHTGPPPPNCIMTVPSNDPECQRLQESWRPAEQDRLRNQAPNFGQ